MDLAFLQSTIKDNADPAGLSLQLKKSNPCSAYKDTLEELLTTSLCNKSFLVILLATDAMEDGLILHTNTSLAQEELTLMHLTHTAAKPELANSTHPMFKLVFPAGAMLDKTTKQPCCHSSPLLDL